MVLFLIVLSPLACFYLIALAKCRSILNEFERSRDLPVERVRERVKERVKERVRERVRG